jgi:hypothetical protein
MMILIIATANRNKWLYILEKCYSIFESIFNMQVSVSLY